MTNPLVPLFGDRSNSSDDLEFHQGIVLEWNTDEGTNVIRALGKDLVNLPMLTSAPITAMGPGATVGLLRYKTTFFVIGTVVTSANPLAMPYTPVVMYPWFTSLGTVGNGEMPRLTVGSPAQWVGVTRIIQPFIWVKGHWGPFSGTNTTTYELRIGLDTIASWTASVADPNLKGPFAIPDINYIGYTDVSIAATAWTGSGTYAFAVEGVYFTGH